MCDLVIVLFRHWRGELGNFNLLRILFEWLQALGQLGEETFHADAVVCGELDLGVVRMELDGTVSGDLVGEVASVEVALETANGDNEFGTLDFLSDLWTTDASYIDLVQLSNGVQ